MEQEAAERKYAALHEARPWHDGRFQNWTTERTAGTPYHFSDGVTISVADVDLNPTDYFLGGEPEQD